MVGVTLRIASIDTTEDQVKVRHVEWSFHGCLVNARVLFNSKETDGMVWRFRLAGVIRPQNDGMRLLQ